MPGRIIVGACVNWTGYCWPSGYGCIKRGGKAQRVHKYLYEKNFGKIKRGLVLDHLCRNKKCINLKHLEVVTVAENTRRGLSAKLNEKQVGIIKKLYLHGESQISISKKFGVNQSQVSRIINEKRWYGSRKTNRTNR